MTDEDGLTDAERRELERLAAQSPLPGGLEDRVVAALREQGLVGPGAPRPSRRKVLELTAAAGLFGAGMGSGLLAARRREQPRPPAAAGLDRGAEPLFLLLLHGGPAYTEARGPAAAARVAEYGAWAGELRGAGRLVAAERLARDARLLESAGDGGPIDGALGFFLVRAADRAAAEAMARACPHLRHGGRVSLQAVDPT
jgi:hypothetical protein